MEQSFAVLPGDVGSRLDKWLCLKMPNVSRKKIKALLDAGRVLINGRRVVIASWELEEGDQVDVRASQVEMSESDEEGDASPARDPGGEVNGASSGRPVAENPVGTSLDRYLEKRHKRVERALPPAGKRASASGAREGAAGQRPEKGRKRLQVYFEDRDLIVVEKPSGILSLPAREKDDRDNMIARVRAYLRRRYPGSKHSFVGPLHRLDAETSGIMVFALSKEGQRLSEQFRRHSLHRSYVAIAAGCIPKEQGVIQKRLEKGDFGGGRKVDEAEAGEGKRAVTEFRVKERYRDATLLDVTVRTGRTHQIRVHLASEGFPILGDALYADAEVPEVQKIAQEVLGFQRHALHAASLGFKHPSGGQKLRFRSPMPDDMKALVDRLRERA